MSSDAKKPLSFRFSKKKETKVLVESRNNLGLGLVGLGIALGGETLDSSSEERANKNDLITSIEGKKVISLVPKEEPKELVIPLLKRNTWSIKSNTTKKQRFSSDAPPKSPANDRLCLDDAAVQEILSDTAKQNMEWEDRGNEDKGMSIPLLMQNKVPEGFETDDKLDVSIRPNEATDADYDQVPIRQFGVAMLRGMGWNDGEGIGGTKKEVVKLLEPKLRPKGQGLGAAPKPPVFSTKPKRPLKPGEKKQEELAPIGYANGVGIMATKGPHKNMYGRIEGVDEDNVQLIIKLAIGGQSVTVSQHIAKIVDDDEYRKYTKDLSRLSKSKDNHRKERNEEDSRDRKEDKREEERTERQGHSRERDEHYYQKSEKHQETKYTDEMYRQKSDWHYGKDGGSKHKREYHDKDRHENKRKEESLSSSKSLNQHWLRPDLRVRFIDKVYKKGKYYMSKVTIEDVVTLEQCTCKTDDGYLLYDIPECMLETVIPKTEPGYVVIVLGKHKGKLGIVVKKHKGRQRADVQLLQDRDTIIHLNYEEICQYAGDIHSIEDF